VIVGAPVSFPICIAVNAAECEVYMSVNSVNPNALFGGTWVAWGTGRVPVGIDTSQTEFNTIEKTGGHKSLQAHNHRIGYRLTNTQPGSSMWVVDPGTIENWNGGVIESTGGGNAQNLQPYITCYMWKRTA